MEKISFKEFIAEGQIQTLGSLYNDLVTQYPDQAQRIKAVLKDLAPSMVSGYKDYSRPNPEADAWRIGQGLRPVKRTGPELATLNPEQYEQIKMKVLQVLGM